MSHSSPTEPLPLREAWQRLADGLHIQRFHLHRDEWADLVNGRTEPRTPLPAAPLASWPGRPASAVAQRLIERAGLGAWTWLPRQYGVSIAAESPLSPAIAGIADLLMAGVRDAEVRESVSLVCAASAWWVGTFATIRHLGVHHLTLQPVRDEIGLDVLDEAAAMVAVGTASRVLRQHIGVCSDDEAVRLAYCRAITEGIVRESLVPVLLEALGELRLVDLVSTSVVWRGQFAKYAGGTGAGQVE